MSKNIEELFETVEYDEDSPEWDADKEDLDDNEEGEEIEEEGWVEMEKSSFAPGGFHQQKDTYPEFENQTSAPKKSKSFQEMRKTINNIIQKAREEEII
ncbi:MAG: hypothetical protein AABX71_03510, partial [Nanoarchaeota archaeon]